LSGFIIWGLLIQPFLQRKPVCTLSTVFLF
jgi:hypothetical protein